MTKRSPFRYFRTSPEITRRAGLLYVRFPLRLRNLEELLHERGIVGQGQSSAFKNAMQPLLPAYC